MSRKRRYEPKAFESSRESQGRKSEPYASIYHSMMTSEAYLSLTPRQRDLYTFCKLQFYDEVPRGEPKFTMNRYKWCNTYHLYTEGNAAAFYRDMRALIEHGLIDCVSPGALTHQKNEYRLSARWIDYGTNDFKMPVNCMTAAMARDFREKKGRHSDK